MDSAEPLSSILWTPPPHPGDVRCGGALLLPRVYRDIGIQHPVLSLLPSSEFYLAICVRAGIVRVSVGVPSLYRTFFIIGGRSFVPAAMWCFAMAFCRICADRDWVYCFGGYRYGIFVSLERCSLYEIPVFLQFQPHERFFTSFFCPAQLVKWACIQRNWKKWRGQR